MKYKAGIIFVLGVMVYAMIFSTFPLTTPKAAASPTKGTINGTWIDHSHINIPGNQHGYPGGTFFDNKIDRTLAYVIQGQSDNCMQKDNIVLGPNSDGGVGYAADIQYASQGRLYIHTLDSNGNCVNSEIDTINFSNTNNFEAFFVWVDSNTIQRTDGNQNLVFTGDALATATLSPVVTPQATPSGTFTHISSDNAAIAPDTCIDQMQLAGGKIGATNSTLIVSQYALSLMQSGWPNNIAQAKANLQPNSTQSAGLGCVSTFTGPIANVLIADPIAANGKLASTIAPAPPASTNGQSGQGSQTTPTCESSGFSLSWIFCPIINGLAKAIDGIYGNIVQPLLYTRSINISDPQSDPTHLYEIWSNFRLYGDIFLVITLLILVFGESLGGGMLEAYTVKKVLPRLLAAAIFINLSIYIAALAVDITNILGNGIMALIEQPFKSAGHFSLQLNGFTSGLGIAGLVGTAFAGAALLPELLLFLFTFVLLPAFLIMLAILATVLIRRGLIILLILSAPIAFALYCLPNTEKYFKQWWDLLLKTLLVYPIIAVMFAVANVLSITIAAGGDTSGLTSTVAQLLAIIALFVPLALIPYSFKIAGGALGKIHEVLTSSAKRGHQAILGNQNDPWSLRNTARRDMSNRLLLGRERLINRANDRQIAGGRYGLLARAAGIQRNDVLRARLNKESSEMSQALVGTGDDWRYRAAFARQLNYTDDKGKQRVGWFNTNAVDDGVIGANGLATLIKGTGTQYSDEQVRRSKGFVRSDPSHYQAGLTYELGSKAGDKNDVLRVLDAHDRNMQEMAIGDQQKPMWVGTVFTAQNKYKDLKHTRPDSSNPGSYVRNSRDHSREHAQTVGTYALSQMSEQTVDALSDDYMNAKAFLTLQDPNASAGDKAAAQQIQAELGNRKVKIRPLRDAAEAQEVVDNVTMTANSLNNRMLTSGTYALEGESPVSGAQTGAPGAVQKSIDNLVQLAATNQQRGRTGNRNNANPGSFS